MLSPISAGLFSLAAANSLFGLSGSLQAAYLFQQSQQKEYPQAYVESYVEACAVDDSARTELVCHCVIEESEANYSFDEFQEVNIAIEETGEIPDKLQAIIDTCRENPFPDD